MEQGGNGARPQDRWSRWIDTLQRNWSGDFPDGRQEAIWNKASASGLYLIMWVGAVVASGFITVDASRYAACALALCLITAGGPVYAQVTARRQNVRPLGRVPSWPVMAVHALLFGLLFFVITRALDPGQDWRGSAVGSVVVAVFWAVVLRFVLQRRQGSAISTGSPAPGGR